MAVKPLPFAFNAQTPSRAITDALTADLAVIRTQLRPRGKRKAPVDIELHANPAALGVLAVGLGLGLWLTQQRIAPSTVAVGHWAWPDGTKAGGQKLERDKGDTPTRRIVVGTETRYGHFGEPHEVPVYATETATWYPDGEKTVLALRERRGFLGNGVGTDTSLEELPWKLLTDPWGLFPW